MERAPVAPVLTPAEAAAELGVRPSTVLAIDQGPTRAVDEAVVQTYRESDGGWDYPPEPGEAARKLGEALG